MCLPRWGENPQALPHGSFTRCVAFQVNVLVHFKLCGCRQASVLGCECEVSCICVSLCGMCIRGCQSQCVSAGWVCGALVVCMSQQVQYLRERALEDRWCFWVGLCVCMCEASSTLSPLGLCGCVWDTVASPLGHVLGVEWARACMLIEPCHLRCQRPKVELREKVSLREEAAWPPAFWQGGISTHFYAPGSLHGTLLLLTFHP